MSADTVVYIQQQKDGSWCTWLDHMSNTDPAPKPTKANPFFGEAPTYRDAQLYADNIEKELEYLEYGIQLLDSLFDVGATAAAPEYTWATNSLGKQVKQWQVQYVDCGCSGDCLEDGYVFMTSLLDPSDPNNLDHIAVEIAEDFFHNHDGWEASWPLTFEIGYQGKSLGKWKIELEAQPVFSARKQS